MGRHFQIVSRLGSLLVVVAVVVVIGLIVVVGLRLVVKDLAVVVAVSVKQYYGVGL